MRPSDIATCALTALYLINSPVAASDRAGLAPRTWTLSASEVDPYVNSGLPTFELRDLHLWVVPNEFLPGWERACFDISATGIIIVSVSPRLDIQIVGDCFYSSDWCFEPLVATVTVVDLPGELCFSVSSTHGTNCTLDCGGAPHAEWENSWIGYSNLGSAPCSYETSGLCEPPISVETGTWGRIKTQYR